jgi:hypothetical protein
MAEQCDDSRLEGKNLARRIGLFEATKSIYLKNKKLIKLNSLINKIICH